MLTDRKSTMPTFVRCFQRIFLFATLAFFLFETSGAIGFSQASRPSGRPAPDRRVRMLICTNHEKYSLDDYLTINALLENTGDDPVYVDRRMFWTGLSGGLKLVISDETGRFLPAQPFSDAMMQPPRPDDTSILIPLNRGFLYGTSLRLQVRGFFPKPGRYSIRVVYQSMISKEFVAPQLRNLPALWSDTPSIPSDPAWIEVSERPHR